MSRYEAFFGIVRTNPVCYNPRVAMMLYLDHNATTPLDPAVREAMLGAQWAEANPSSIHRPGREARKTLELARRQLAHVLGAHPAEMVFTASGSEGNNLALKGTMFNGLGRGGHLVISAIEHDSVRQCARWLVRQFPEFTLTEVLPDGQGRIGVQAVLAALREDTKLVSLMLANHETGMRQPVEELAPVLHERGIALHVDAVQALGRMAVDVRRLGCDLLTLAAHKFYGPKGVGALYVRAGTALTPLLHGGSQEQGLRAGTGNAAGAAGMATAAELAAEWLTDTVAHLSEMEQVFWGVLMQSGLPIELNGGWDDKLPGALNLSIRGIASEDMVVGLDVAGVAISAGSACASGVMEPSPVLQAMQLEPWRVAGGIRISFGRENTLDEARHAAQLLVDLARKLSAPGSGAQPGERATSL
jgi:cysteine desulfurase